MMKSTPGDDTHSDLEGRSEAIFCSPQKPLATALRAATNP